VFDLERWAELWVSVRRNRMRALLTGLAVAWGMFMLVTTAAFSRELQFVVGSSLRGFAANTVHVWPVRTTMPHAGLQAGRKFEFDNQDSATLSRVPGIEHLAPRLRIGGFLPPVGVNVARGNLSGNFAVIGNVPEFGLILKLEIVEGRFLNWLDIDERRKVAVIGDKVRDFLFPETDDVPIGQHINIKGVWFEVVGVFASDGESGHGEPHDQSVIVPLTTVQQAFSLQDRVNAFALTVRAGESAHLVEDQVERALQERHLIHPDDRSALGVFNTAAEFEKSQRVLAGIKVFTWIASILTLLAAVLGVSNIVLISVKERTREIGIRKALGATTGSVMRMVIEEALLVTSVAGYFGLLGSIVVVHWVARLFEGNPLVGQPTIDFTTALVSIAILVGSGALAGLIPAYYAARIPPVAALRADS